MVIMIYIVLFGIFAVLAFFLLLRKDGRKRRRIPGPNGFPLLGCVLEVNAENIFVKFSEYAREYGDIFQVNLMNNTFVGLNSENLIRLAFSEDGYRQYLNNKPATFYGEMFFYGSQCTVLSKDGYSADHNAYRKGFIKATKEYATGGGYSVLEENIMREIKSGLLEKIESYTGGDFEIVSELKSSLSNTLSCLLIGQTFSENDPNGMVIEEFSDSTDFFLSSSVNDVLSPMPFLRHMPGPYRKQFTRAVKTKETVINAFFKQQKESYVPGVIRGAVDYSLKEQIKDREAGREPFFTDERIISQILEIMATGLLTTWGFLSNAFLCLLNHPEYQDKMFEELDRIVGRDRDLNQNDKAQCPFVEAVELEVHRYIPTVPLLDPKLCKVNLEFQGFDLPKGSLVIGNVWHIHHNEKIWGDPWNFRPERWLDDQGNLVPKDHVYRKNWFPFGSGRRQCVGESLARSVSFLYLGSLFRRWKFVSSPGKAVSCDPRDQSNYDIKVTIRPKPFYCQVQERY